MKKPRTRLYIVGQATYRLTRHDRGWGGPYGQNRQPAQWSCIECGRTISGTEDHPYASRNGAREWSEACARNGHAPCQQCGKKLPRLNDGCPREHNWTHCPGKTPADRTQPQHADKHHRTR